MKRDEEETDGGEHSRARHTETEEDRGRQRKTRTAERDIIRLIRERIHEARDAKVRQFQHMPPVRVVDEEQVLALDVAMHNVQRVQERESFQNLECVVAHECFGEAFVVAARERDEGRDGAAARELEKDAER